jgi:REP element-mobilizing transposase RayT
VVDYRRNLPHWFPQSASVFLTWRLHGSLPAGFSPPGALRRLSSGEQFKFADGELDRGATGPLWLKNPQIAANVVKTLQKGGGELHHYDLFAYVVMANHVHVLLAPPVEVRMLTRSLKGVTARVANLILHRTGQRFWQEESFDHWVRGPAQFARIKSYIERNPVTAGLVTTPEDWPWSSTSRPLP